MSSGLGPTRHTLRGLVEICHYYVFLAHWTVPSSHVWILIRYLQLPLFITHKLVSHNFSNNPWRPPVCSFVCSCPVRDDPSARPYSMRITMVGPREVQHGAGKGVGFHGRLVDRSGGQSARRVANL